MPDEKRCGTCEHWKGDKPILDEHSLGKCRFFDQQDIPSWMVLGRPPNCTGEGLTPACYGANCAVWSPKKGSRT